MKNLIFFLLIFLPLTLCAQGELKRHTKVLKLMGSRFEITAVHEDDTLAWEAIRACIAEIERIERLISEWDTLSQTHQINIQAGVRPVLVDEELFALIRRSKKVSELTNGAFDISFAAIDKIWRFDGSMKEMPPAEKIKNSVRLINYQDILLDENQKSVFLKNKGMKIGFGAIGKGYAANRGKKVMQALGIRSGIVNAGGDLIAWGNNATGEPWKIGITDPNDKNKMISWLNVADMAVVTSGDYEKFVVFDGIRYAHIIDPHTGYPARGLKSVTILCPDAELADALATGVFVLGETPGLALINQLKGIQCLIITDRNEIKTSQGLELNLISDSTQKD
ncbi:MAG: FAD:protein FMN transferase [Microscillaceae bacterium]|nr:FAD:protein FMN transferase [Microscillaceae bacterium]